MVLILEWNSTKSRWSCSSFYFLNACLVLGDNIYYGHGFTDLLKQSVKNIKESNSATVFGYDPQRYGVAGFDENVTSIEEKPQNQTTQLQDYIFIQMM